MPSHPSRLFAGAVAAALLALATGPAAADAKEPRIHARRDGHSWANSYAFALASNHAYRREVKDRPGATWLARYDHAYRELGLRALAFISRSERGADTQVVIAGNDDILLVAFSGSETHVSEAALRDWLSTDLRLWSYAPPWQKPTRHCKRYRVHKGFDTALAVVYPELRRQIRAQLTGERRLWITGHSLGGALANLAAMRLRLDGFAIQGVHTYGAPRVGNGCFAKAYQPLAARTQRWLHGLDPVPHTPPFPYTGVGVNNILRAGGKVDLDGVVRPPLTPLVALLAKRMAGAYLAFAAPNHMIGSYLDRIYDEMPPKARAGLPPPPKVERKEARKEARKERKAERKAARQERKAERKERRQAR